MTMRRPTTIRCGGPLGLMAGGACPYGLSRSTGRSRRPTVSGIARSKVSFTHSPESLGRSPVRSPAASDRPPGSSRVSINVPSGRHRLTVVKYHFPGTPHASSPTGLATTLVHKDTIGGGLPTAPVALQTPGTRLTRSRTGGHTWKPHITNTARSKQTGFGTG